MQFKDLAELAGQMAKSFEFTSKKFDSCVYVSVSSDARCDADTAMSYAAGGRG